VLHIHSGDSSADEARKASIPGLHLPWREALVAGPIPRPDQDWVQIRGAHLGEAYGADGAEFTREMARFRQALETAPDHDELVLWFDSDLFCQVNLCYLLGQVQDVDQVSLSPAHHGTDPAVSFAARRVLTAEERAAGSSAWRAYASDDPRNVEAEVRNHSRFATALRLHLLRYPSTENGLGAIERTILQLVADGKTSFHALFHGFWAAAGGFGYGDAQVWNELVRLTRGQRPLLRVAGDPPEARISLTKDAAGILSGQGDYVAWNGIDLWLGGVHLTGAESGWRWNGQRLVPR